MERYAKSPEQGGLTLLQPTQQVLDTILKMAGLYSFTLRLARLGAIPHDLGKPYRQRIVQGLISEFERQQADPHRHEIPSLLFLPLFEKIDWPILIGMVAAHHKSVKVVLNNGSQRGLPKLVYEKYRANDVSNRHVCYVYQEHNEARETWSTRIEILLRLYKIKFRPIRREGACTTFDFDIAHCPFGWSRWRGLLMNANYFASDYIDKAKKQGSGFYRQPLGYYSQKDDPFLLLPANRRNRHTFVVAPSVAGKTDFLLRRCQECVVYTLQFQASINAMPVPFAHDLNKKDVQGLPKNVQTDNWRVHAASRIQIRHDDGKTVEEDQFRQRDPEASIKVTTTHQLAAIIFSTSGHEAASLNVVGCDAILDEVHIYDNPSSAKMLDLVKALVRLGWSVHIGRTTIPEALRQKRIEVLGGRRGVYKVSFKKRTFKKINWHKVSKVGDEIEERAIVEWAISRESKEQVLFVANRMDMVQKWYEWVKTKFPNVSTLLVHNRFRRCNRAVLESKISEYNRSNDPFATQVVEVRLDILFDLVIDAGSPDGLVQRFEQIPRRRSVQTIGTDRAIHLIDPTLTGKEILLYDANMVRRSYDLLPDGLLREIELQWLINEVYTDIVVPSIEVHTIPVRELCHWLKSVLIDALEIEGVAFVPELDEEIYLKTYRPKYLELENPVPKKLAVWFSGIRIGLETGSYLFLVK